jgi:hypothetical protein
LLLVPREQLLLLMLLVWVTTRVWLGWQPLATCVWRQESWRQQESWR